MLILRVNDLPCGALKTTTPSPGPLALHQDLCHLKPMQPRDQQMAEPLGSKASPCRTALPASFSPEDEAGAGGQGAEVEACGVRPGWGFLCVSTPDASSPPWSPRWTRASGGSVGSPHASTSLSADQVLSRPRRGARGAPPLKGPSFLYLPLWGPPAWKGCLHCFPTRGPLVFSRSVRRAGPQGTHRQGRPCVFLRDSASPQGPLKGIDHPGRHQTLSAFSRS